MAIRANEVILGGNLGKDPIIKTTSGGKKVAEVTMAVSEGKDKPTNWFDIVAWEKQAEFAEKYLHKGDAVLVIGKLKQDTWEKDGKPMSRVRVVANSIQSAGSRPAGGGAGAVPSDDDIPF